MCTSAESFDARLEQAKASALAFQKTALTILNDAQRTHSATVGLHQVTIKTLQEDLDKRVAQIRALENHNSTLTEDKRRVENKLYESGREKGDLERLALEAERILSVISKRELQDDADMPPIHRWTEIAVDLEAVQKRVSDLEEGLDRSEVSLWVSLLPYLPPTLPKT